MRAFRFPNNCEAFNIIKYSSHKVKIEALSQLQDEIKCKKLPPGTECLISGDVIAEKEYYKMCFVKPEHIISFKSWVSIGDKLDRCCFCKTLMADEFIYQNK